MTELENSLNEAKNFTKAKEHKKALSIYEDPLFE